MEGNLESCQKHAFALAVSSTPHSRVDVPCFHLNRTFDQVSRCAPARKCEQAPSSRTAHVERGTAAIRVELISERFTGAVDLVCSRGIQRSPEEMPLTALTRWSVVRAARQLPLRPLRRSLTASASSNIACIFDAVKFKLGEADRLNRKGEAVEARSLYLEAQKAAEIGSQDVRMQRLAARWPKPRGLEGPEVGTARRVPLQVAIEAALLQAEEASAAMAV
eukprot:s1826_g6.t1